MSDAAEVRDNVCRLIGWATAEVAVTKSVAEESAPGGPAENAETHHYCRGHIVAHEQWIRAMTDVARDLITLAGDDGPFI